MSDQIIPYHKTIDTEAPAQELPCKPARLAEALPVLEPRLQEEDIENIAVLLKAMAHPVRIKILDLIGQGEGEVCSCELERFFTLSQPTISHHLKILQEASLITSEARGVWVYHSLRPQAFDLVRQHLVQIQSAR
jgi:ArsR family transcriptional regulator, arsenate/arsenite/antimonite-responsive transcriptional repressor